MSTDSIFKTSTIVKPDSIRNGANLVTELLFEILKSFY